MAFPEIQEFGLFDRIQIRGGHWPLLQLHWSHGVCLPIEQIDIRLRGLDCFHTQDDTGFTERPALLVGLDVRPRNFALSPSRHLVRVRCFLPLAELYKVLDELDPHLNRLILVEIIERLEEQSGDRGSLLELVLDGRWYEHAEG